ncbi:MAG: OmpA family protein [Acidobacteriota bacterium]|jgi:outer membrane protein OmpA-like peptidoglycan-associated protein
MKGRWTVLALVGLLGLGGLVAAQDEGSGGTRTVTRDEVKSWIFEVDGKEWSVRPAAPTAMGDTGLFRLVGSAYTLPKGYFSVGYSFDNMDRDPKGTDFATHGATFAYGVSNRFELFGALGVQSRTKAHYLEELGGPNEYPFPNESFSTGFGDVWLGAKYAILNDYLGDGAGLALKGFVKLPTADEAKGLGTGKASFGADLILSKTLNYGADLHGVVGYELNGNPDTPTVSPDTFQGPDFVANAFRWGVGLNVPACTRFQLQAELSGKAYGDTTVSQTNTTDLSAGVAAWLGDGFYLRAAYVYALGYDGRGRDVSGAKRSGMNFAIGFHGGTPCCEIYTPPPPPPAPANRPPTVSLTCEPSPVLPGQVSECRATASDPDGDPLTYAWTAGAGRISGTGAQTSLDTAGIPAGDCTPVTVKVSDGRGGTAEATSRVCVQEPPKPKPEAVSCTSGGFPRNLSRLNNVDKACLDDVASKLRQDPRSRVIIVGHADSAERYTEVIGRKRAEAVKDYLVTERGIAEARITAKSAADSKPLDTAKNARARAKNRRVDVIFVPEGATVPEDD